MIRQRCTEIAHITVHEVLDRSGYPQLGRIMFSGVDLSAFIESEMDDGHDDDEEDREREATTTRSPRPSATSPAWTTA